MKKIIFISFLFFIAACGSKQDPTPANNSNNTTDMNSNDQTDTTAMDTTAMDNVMLSGEFQSSGSDSVSGTARVEGSTLYLDNFSTSNGPDLKVYISTDKEASNYIRVGALKQESGDQQYTLDGPIDFTKYPYVLIWCEQFTVLFGYAKLQ